MIATTPNQTPNDKYLNIKHVKIGDAIFNSGDLMWYIPGSDKDNKFSFNGTSAM